MKFIGKTLSVILGLSAVTGTALANQYIEITQTFVPQLVQASMGDREEIGWTEFDSRCLVKNPLGGCITQERKQGKGSMTLTGLLSQSGRVHRVIVDDDPNYPAPVGNAYSSTLFMEFHYDGHTEAEKYEQDVLVDHPWGDLSPSGRIQMWLVACPGTRFALNVKFIADPGHDDAPNNFLVQYVAPRIEQRIASNVTRLLNTGVTVVTGDPTSSCYAPH